MVTTRARTQAKGAEEMKRQEKQGQEVEEVKHEEKTPPAREEAKGEPETPRKEELVEVEPEEREKPAERKEEGGVSPDERPSSEGEEEAPKVREEPPHKRQKTDGVIEEGKVYFFYRPRVERDEPQSLQDVQRFHMLLQPSKDGAKCRMATIGKKRLPSAVRHERFFGFVEASAETSAELTKGLAAKTYETKTQGVREQPAARSVGEGVYSIVMDQNERTSHFMYRLELPQEPGEVQEDFKILKEGKFVFQIKNPLNEPPSGAPIGLQEKADYPEDKMKKFGSYAWIPVKDSQLLDTPRCEFLMIGIAEDTGGVNIEETICDEEDDEACMLEEMKRATQVEMAGIPTEPLETKEWK